MNTTDTIRRGYTFTHDRFRQQIAGVKVADSPHAEMVVTRVTDTTVFYNHVGETKGAWRLDRAEFTARFAA